VARTELTEKQELALRFEALVERVGVAEIRRRALAHYADELLRNEHVRAGVLAALRYRREHGVHRPVTTLRSIHG
jgi:hypothetical protein